jgi:hypothetical protein
MVNHEDIQAGDWVCIKFVQGWFKIQGIRNGLISTVEGPNYSVSEVVDHKRITPISVTEFQGINVGDEIEIAPEWYIRSKLDINNSYKGLIYFLGDSPESKYNSKKQKHRATPAVVMGKLLDGCVCINSGYVHMDFILAVLKNGVVYYAKHIQDVSLVAPSTSTDHTPIPQLRESKPLLLKNCPVWSFVKLKSKEGLLTPWGRIISKGVHEIIFSQNGSEGSPDPESEVLALITKIEDIPKHALIRIKYSKVYTAFSEFQGKFSDIDAIIEESQKNSKLEKDKPISTDLQVGRWVMLQDYVGYHKIHKITENQPQLNVGTLKMWVRAQAVIDVRIAIPDQEWNKLKPGMWVKIAPKEYVKSKLDDIGLYKSTEYNNAKLDSCADSWQEIKYMSCDTEIISFLGNYWHRDFIVDTSETKPLSCSGTPTTVASYGSARREVIAPISDDLWDKLKEGWWVKIAPEDYIKNLLDVNGTYLDIDYRSSRRKKNTFGTWQKVVRKHTSKPSVGVCDTFSIHRDFIVDISETEPQMNCRVLTAKEYFSKHTTSNVSGIGIELDTVNGHTNACKEIPLPGVGGMCVLGTTPTEPDWYYKYLMKDKIKENTMNTVEDIKKLDAANLEEAAKQVKASRDNDEVAAAKSKLTQLLNQESGLKARKKEIDADLAEVQELIKAFGYPPKEGK